MNTFIEEINNFISNVSKNKFSRLNNIGIKYFYSSPIFIFLHNNEMFEVYFKQIQLILGDEAMIYYNKYVETFNLEPFITTDERNRCSIQLKKLNFLSKTRNCIINFTNEEKNSSSTLLIQIINREITYMSIFSRSINYSSFFLKDMITFYFLSIIVFSLLKSKKIQLDHYISEIYDIGSEIKFDNYSIFNTFLDEDLKKIKKSAKKSLEMMIENNPNNRFSNDYFGVVAKMLVTMH